MSVLDPTVAAEIVKDLQRSGLTPDVMRIRTLTNAERAATSVDAGVNGYVIPYFNLDGHPLQFYRVRAFDWLMKYKQIKATQNHVYFPLGVKELILKHKYVIITEGEKKATAAVQAGFPCIGLSGVDSWRNRTLVLPEDTKFMHVPGKDKQLSIKLEDTPLQVDESELAVGMQSIIDLQLKHNIVVFICFDTDITEVDGPDGTTTPSLVKMEVQRAAANLGFELRYRGIQTQKIKQIFLFPPKSKVNGHTIPPKIGLDDFLTLYGPDAFEELVAETLANKRAFPQHPNIVEFVSKKLQASRITRKASQQLALAVLADMDSKGMRMRNNIMGSLYYFISKNKTLMEVSLARKMNDVMSTTEFTRHLFTTYGISPSDAKILEWVATYFNTELPINRVNPKHVTIVEGDHIYHQVSDGEFAVISPNANECRIVDNGTHDVLFSSGAVEEMDTDTLAKEYARQLVNPLPALWPSVTKQLRLRDTAEQGHPHKFFALMCYLSPWIQRWRGTQLPIEMCIGEAGSGKSSIYELRLNIQTGRPELRNAPESIRDWYASIASSGGMHVTDNIHAMDKTVKARMSDELCRLCTEPTPQVEMRKLYSNNELVKTPVNPVFALTAIQQPFRNTDIIQRSVIFDFDKGENVIGFVSRWPDTQLNESGGRYVWLAHQFTILHRFLKLAKEKWNPRFHSKHRLINFEQSLHLMHSIVFPSESSDWIPTYLTKVVEENAATADWTFEGLDEFVKYWQEAMPNQPFTVSDITSWAETEQDFRNNVALNSNRILGRYIQTHKNQLASTLGIHERGKKANIMHYYIRAKPRS